MATTRVAQWATGTTGRLALGAVIDAPDLELVGVRVYDESKVGQDAGALAGRAPTGVLATDQRADVTAANADVVLYMGSVERYPDGCFDDVIALLASGADVIATGSSFIDVRAFAPERATAIEAACEQGSSTFLGVGIFPGFWGEAMVPLLARLSNRCEEIVVRESLSYAGYPSRDLMFDVMGYGQAPDSNEPLMSDPSKAGGAFIGTLTVVAKAVGLEITTTRSFRETAITDHDLTVACGVIPAGTVGAMKLGVRAECGSTSIAVEHVTWMDPLVAPEWSSRGEGYEIEFGGAPSMRCHLLLGIHGENHNEMGCLATAMHAVRAIPVVQTAPPGILDLADVAGFVGKLA